MVQHGFLFDQSRCFGCHACTLACKNWNGLPAGPVKYLRIYEYEKGAFPNVRTHFQWVTCYHCTNPVCIKACKNQAIHKEGKYGAVLIDAERCKGDRRCWKACPYGAMVYENDDKGTKAQKCTMCLDRLEAGEVPICVSSCSARALDFGPIHVLKERYGDNSDLEDMPSSRITNPSVVCKTHAPKRQLVPYDATRALELMKKRGPLPPLFASVADVVDIPEGFVGSSELVIKHKTVADLMRRSRNHEG